MNTYLYRNEIPNQRYKTFHSTNRYMVVLACRTFITVNFWASGIDRIIYSNFLDSFPRKKHTSKNRQTQPNSFCPHHCTRPAFLVFVVAEMIAKPLETKSDSFYFVDGRLVMHNRAEYSYSD